ncbi:MAG: YkgJ family cysteine cluster protein [Thauera sp.]
MALTTPCRAARHTANTPPPTRATASPALHDDLDTRMILFGLGWSLARLQALDLLQPSVGFGLEAANGMMRRRAWSIGGDQPAGVTRPGWRYPRRLARPPRTIRQKMPTPTAAPLLHLHADIDARVGAIRQSHPDWQCARGCATCCRQLADIPRLTAAEWALLKQGFAALPPERLTDIRNKVAELARTPSRPVVCPMLDELEGACPVYAQRPVACRTYGFYVQRALGLYCGDIEARVADGELSDVVWGNHDAVDQALGALGELRTLTEWFEGDATISRRAP